MPIMVNIERWLGHFVILQGIQTGIAKKPYNFVIFQGGLDPLSPPLNPRMFREMLQNYGLQHLWFKL